MWTTDSMNKKKSFNTFVILLVVVFMIGIIRMYFQPTGGGQQQHETSATLVTLNSKKCFPTVWLPPFRKRVDLGDILHDLKMKTGVELGVQKGEFAFEVLKRWRTAEGIVKKFHNSYQMLFYFYALLMFTSLPFVLK